MASSTQRQSFEIQQAYAEMTTSLSSQLISSALAMLALEGAFFTFIVDKRLPNYCFYFSIGFSALLFVSSIYMGGKGINMLRGKLYRQEITDGIGKPCFNRQAILSVLALFFFALNFFISLSLPGQNSDFESRIKKMEADVMITKSGMAKLESYGCKIDKILSKELGLEEKIKNLESKF